MTRALVAILVGGVALLLGLPALAHAGDVEVVVVPSLDLAEASARGAVGLLVPGSGETVTRAGALSALERGRATSALIGGVTEGDVLVTPSPRPGARATVYVVLPPPGRSRNTRRYPVAVVGEGYRGLLTSSSTRIPGLVSIADVAPTVLALREARRPPLRWRPDDDAAATARALDRRLTEVSRPRDPVTIALVVTALALALASLATRRALPARAVAAAPLCALAVSLLLSAVGWTSPSAASVLAFGATIPLALAVTWSRRVAAWLLGAFVAVLLVLLAWWPHVPALAVIGPHPESGGRFFGVTNLVETLLLVATVAVVSVAPVVPAVGLAAITLVAVGWSRAGADGGGILVLGAAYLVVALLRQGRGRLGPARLALGAVAVGGGAVALVLVDRLAGGSSHVTRAVDDGPGGLLGDLGRRLEVSWHAATHNPHTVVICLVSLAAVVAVATRLPRTVGSTALLVGLAVSLLVNDSPPDVLVTVALGLAGLGLEERARRAHPVPEPRPGGDGGEAAASGALV